ncbi:hypothetical protein ACFRCG_29275 [Embleya sp. NPDC056575]|uniref:hypothetical protein n=1 Tax=unclassified Embleya TaxID=2699296 RepID=UPI0036CFBE63
MAPAHPDPGLTRASRLPPQRQPGTTRSSRNRRGRVVVRFGGRSVDPETPDDLTPAEHARLADCIAGVELLSTDHWIAGKSLDTIARGKPFRQLPHRLEPHRCYRTIEEWAETEHGISQSRCSKLRAGWKLGDTVRPDVHRAAPALKRDVDRRAVALADRPDRGRIPRQEVLAHLLAAFVDDPRVFDAVLERMKTAR